MAETRGLAGKAVAVLKDVTAHWSKPAEGKYISYKEMTAYSAGGIGVNTVNAIFQKYLPLNAGCFLFGAVYGIKPTHLAFIGIFTTLVNLVKTPFVSMLIDNTNSKHGKFRPYLLYTGLPTVLFLILSAYIPVGAAYNTRLALITVLYTLLILFQSVYDMAYKSLAQVMTPNSEERTLLLSVSNLVFNFGPSLVDILFPVLAVLVAAGLRDVQAYRILFPVFSIVGVLLGMWVFFSTQEKIVVPHSYVAKVKFSDGLRQAGGNKYFWQITLFHILGAMKSEIQKILPWFFVYALGNEALLGVAFAVSGTAFVPGMVLSPWLAKALKGKRNVLITANALHVAFTVLMLFTMRQTILFFLFFYLANMMVGTDGVMTASMFADVFDYQQWRTGKRYEGFMTNFSGMVVSVSGSLLGLISPFFFEHYGLLENYDVLFQAGVRDPIFRFLIIASAISGALAVLPLFFYDITEARQKQYIEELKERAAREKPCPID
jgi:GPH family glycoside/pentoside/hexuronide:cation symporter/probable glucitol transport protein GutA